jgi:hypothetical protein
MAMRPYAPSGFTQRVVPVGARRRLAPTSSLPTSTLSTDWGRYVPIWLAELAFKQALADLNVGPTLKMGHRAMSEVFHGEPHDII